MLKEQFISDGYPDGVQTIPFYQILTANHAASHNHMLADTGNCLHIGIGARGKPERLG